MLYQIWVAPDTFEMFEAGSALSRARVEREGMSLLKEFEADTWEDAKEVYNQAWREYPWSEQDHH